MREKRMKVKNFKKIKWGWLYPPLEVCNQYKLQDIVFESPDDAIDEMKRRLGHPLYNLGDIERIGFVLVMVEVEYTPIAVVDRSNKILLSPEDWIDENVVGNPGLIEAMKNYVRDL
jgi:hypothetical protein